MICNNDNNIITEEKQRKLHFNTMGIDLSNNFKSFQLETYCY